VTSMGLNTTDGTLVSTVLTSLLQQGLIATPPSS
jgi:hypothetical protein